MLSLVLVLSVCFTGKKTETLIFFSTINLSILSFCCFVEYLIETLAAGTRGNISGAKACLQKSFYLYVISLSSLFLYFKNIFKYFFISN
jgi:predicted CDP-diglyceride synthetase/phosphatidate cytidylyltransferase